MQAYAEGFDLFDKCEYELDNAKIAHLWGQGSVVRSWLCELAARAFEADGNDLGDRGLHRGLRRGALDDRGRDRPRRADAGDHRLAVRALLLARQRRLRRPRARRAAQPVRRPRRQEQRRVAPMSDRGSDAVAGRATPSGREPADARARAPAGRTRRRSSSSAPPATSPSASCCRRSTTSPTRARCPSASTWSASRAEKDARGLPRPSARRRSASSRAARPTRTCSQGCSRTSSTCPATFDDESRLQRARARCSTSSSRRPASR